MLSGNWFSLTYAASQIILVKTQPGLKQMHVCNPALPTHQLAHIKIEDFRKHFTEMMGEFT
jgi:hypothetical protein